MESIRPGGLGQDPAEAEMEDPGRTQLRMKHSNGLFQPHFYRGSSFHLGDKTCCFLEKPLLLKGYVILAMPQARAPMACTIGAALPGRTTAAGTSFPRGWVLPDVGSWCKSLQAEGAGSLSAQAFTLDSPPLASVPARLLSLLPTQRMSAHSAHALLAEAVRGRHPPQWGWEGL